MSEKFDTLQNALQREVPEIKKEIQDGFKMFLCYLQYSMFKTAFFLTFDKTTQN